MYVCMCVCINYPGDITINDYKLEFYYDGNLNPEVSTLHFYWNLSRKAEHIMDNQFITGFKIVIEHEPKNDTISTISLTQNLILNIILEPNQWYLIIGRILTEDNDTWGPEPVYEYFQTPGNLTYKVVYKKGYFNIK